MEKINITHVIFDWAGTLYDDHHPSYLTTKQVIKELSGKDISFQEYKDYFCLPVLPFYRRYGIDLSLDEINTYFFDRYNENCFKGKIFSGVRETLAYLKRKKVTISILSTLDQKLLEQLCARLHLTNYFSKIQGSVCDKRKELKEHLRAVHKKPQEVLFIGDTDHDIEAARQDNTLSGGVVNGYQPLERLIQARPDFVWNAQTEWVPFFKSFFEKKSQKKKTHLYPLATSGALIFNQEQKALFVLTHKWKYSYGIPGGKIQKGETMAEATVREVQEETGLKIKLGPLLLIQDCIDSREFYHEGQHFVLFNFQAKTKSKKVSLNHEALSYVWLKPEQALNLRLNTPTRILVEHFLETQTYEY